MSVQLSEQELYRLFREQLPSISVPNDLKIMLQGRLLTEVKQTLIPSLSAPTMVSTTLVGTWFSRFLQFVRHFQLTLPIVLLSFGVIGVFTIASTINAVGRPLALLRPPQPAIVSLAPRRASQHGAGAQPMAGSKPTHIAGRFISPIESPIKKETEAAISLPLSLF